MMETDMSSGSPGTCDITPTSDSVGGQMEARGGVGDFTSHIGNYTAVCTDCEGNVVWSEEFRNLLTATGKAFQMQSALNGSSYTAAQFMGLISSASFSAVAAADTMASHAGWLEGGLANAPTYTAPRKTAAFSAAAAVGNTGTIALSAGLAFVFTGTGTVQGAFICAGTGATSTIDNTAGTLYSAGTLSAAQPVISGNTLTISYSGTLS